MGAPITEYYVEQLIKTGLEDIRNTPSKLDVIFEGFTEGLFVNIFGKKVITQIKDFILSRKISVIQGVNIVPENLPCFSVALLDAVEDHSRSAFDDFDSYEMEDVAPEDQDELATFAILSYNSGTGFCSVSDAVDVSTIYVGAIIVDQDGVSFEVMGPILSDTGNKGFYIVADASINTGTVRLLSQIDQTKTGIRAVPIIDRIQVGIHTAENTNLTKYLYYLLVYWLFSRRLELEKAGYQLSRFNASDFAKEVELLPDNIVSRAMTIEFLTWFKWKDDPWSAVRLMSSRILVKQEIWEKNDDTAIGTTED